MDELLTKVKSYLPTDKVGIVEEAYAFAMHSHDGQTRLSGEPYVVHPVQAAMFLAELNLDASTIAATLLHDVIEDWGVTYQDLEQQFGAEVSSLVDGVTKLGKIELLGAGGEVKHNSIEGQAESLRKMLVAMAQDVRVVLIKLADRLHNMRTLKAHSLDKQTVIAQETLDIYAPLAHRLGMWDIKWQLEDLAFSYIHPDKYLEV